MARRRMPALMVAIPKFTTSPRRTFMIFRVACQDDLVDGFQQSRPRLLVDTHADGADRSGNHVELIHPVAPVLSVPPCENDGANVHTDSGADMAGKVTAIRDQTFETEN